MSYYNEQGRIEECSKLVSNISMIMLFLSIPAGAGVFALADKMVYVLFGESFLPATETVRIGVGIVFVLAFSNLYGTQVLLTFKQEKKLLICTLIGAGTNIVLNLMLIPRFQHNGAMVASVISESLVGLYPRPASIDMGARTGAELGLEELFRRIAGETCRSDDVAVIAAPHLVNGDD